MERPKSKVLKHLAHHVKIPGFREGKAPLSVVEKHVDQKTFQSEFLDEALNFLYTEAIRQNTIRPVAPPKVELKKFVPFSELEFTAEVEGVGQVILPDYKKIKVPLMPTAVGEKEVDEVLERLRLQAATKTEVSRAAKKDDEVWLDFKGHDAKGQPVNGADGKDYPLVLGSKTFIPGFEEEIIGLKAGDEKKFDNKFPSDYNVSALRSKKITFKANIKKVNEVKKPELDDKFAATVGPFKTLEELKNDIVKSLVNERTNQARRQQENEIVRKIAEQSTIKIPQVLIEENITELEEEEKRNLAYRGQTWQEHLDEEGITAEEHRERKRPAAEDRVKGGLVLSEVAELEGIKVTPEELEIRIQILKGQYQDKAMQAELDKPENRRDIEARLLTEKTLNRLVEFSETA